METREAVGSWIEAWSDGWRRSDASVIAARYADEAVFHSHFFLAPHLGPRGVAAYAEESFAVEPLVECRFGSPVVDGQRAAVDYWAILRTADGETTLAGVALLRFDAEGRVVAQRDTWVMQPGRHPPHAGWGDQGG